ncbi:MAG: AAA family ATPase [Treponema sp.]|nr:AAA family ATPase [Treponema sp.]
MTINAKQLYFILDNTPASQNIMLVGKHGIGKSRILEDYYAAKGKKVVTLFLGQMADPADLLGLPEKNAETGKTDFMVPYWFPTDGKPVVLFLDELNRSRPEILQVIMDLTLNRKLAGKVLPEGSRIISAVNNGNEYQLTDLDPALVSRFNIYEFSPSIEDWIEWAKNSKIDERIIDFISENPEYLDGEGMSSESENLERSPDRRSWERVSSIISKFPELSDLHKPMISGIIGNKATTIFFDYVFESNTVSASKILTGNFEDVKKKLEQMMVPALTQINTLIFKFFKTDFANTQDTKKIAQNLENYYKFTGDCKGRELKSHFISLCSSKLYPEILNFITENCFESIYQDMISFVKEN